MWGLRRKASLALRQLSYCFGNLGELGVCSATLQPQLMIDGGGSADHGSGGNIVGDAALSDGDGSVANLDVAGDADLSGENDVIAYVGGAGEANLRDEQSVVADGAAMADLDEVVDFRAAADASFSDAGAVDAGVGLQFDVALNDYVAGLDDFVPVAGVVLGEAKTVGTDYGSILQDYVVA